MASTGIIYTLIGYKDIPLAGYSEFKGEFQKLCHDYLSKIDPNSSGGYKINDYFLFYINENNISYIIMTDVHYSKNTALTCLESIKKEFTAVYPNPNFEGAENFSLNKEFRPKLKMSYEYFNENKEVLNESSSKLKDEIFKMRDDIFETYDLLDQRGGKLAAVNDKAEALKEQSVHFHKAAKKVKKSESHRKIYIIIGIILAFLVIGYFLSVIVCGSFYFQCQEKFS